MTELSPIEKFSKQTEDIDDIGRFVCLLASTGVPAFNSCFPPLEFSPQTFERKMESWVSEGVLTVLTNMEQQGRRMEALKAFSRTELINYVEEFIVEERVRIIMARGLLRGYVAAGFIPPDAYEHMYRVKITD